MSNVSRRKIALPRTCRILDTVAFHLEQKHGERAVNREGRRITSTLGIS